MDEKPPRLVIDWLIRREKHPERIDDGRWRWILPDPPTSDEMADLPAPVFHQLIGDDRRFPWIFNSRERAMFGAIMAGTMAYIEGWRPD